ncbi:hypothetical protein [Flavisphingomonas formosensis]|uniref:hypothetical protein n=1 Tax=Flavisphingomonas formosensis TaxID=861534 RepID=UPI0012F9DE9A|nr:hypothetical protein [Sphingomonas formosensis]
MAETKSFASLTSGLLARKGFARPAMRPQPLMPIDGADDDLGWNDVGEQPTPPARQQAEIAHSLGVRQERLEPRPERPAASLLVVPISRAKPGREKAAFTLRLDQERHLRLRVACAVTRRSAQQIVTEALDAFLAKMPEVEEFSHSVAQADGGK